MVYGGILIRVLTSSAALNVRSVVGFTLAGQEFMALNGGMKMEHTHAILFKIDCADQAEVDRLWDGLLANGGKADQCGWLKDRYGVSWQVFPRRLTELTLKADKDVRAKAMAAMMKQKKIDISAIEAAVIA